MGDAMAVGKAVLKALLGIVQAPPPAVMEMATKRPVTMTPMSMAPSEEKALAWPAIQRITK